MRDSVPVSEDGRRVSVVLRRPAGLAELGQGKELQVGAEDGREDSVKKKTMRWGKVVDGEGGKKKGGWLRLRRTRSSRLKQNGMSSSSRRPSHSGGSRACNRVWASFAYRKHTVLVV